jgi:hypothetical protein
MNAYTQTIQAGQEALDTVNILEIADPICSVAEWNAFQTRLFREPRDDTHRRNAICIAFQCGAIGAIEALQMLAADELYGDPDYFMAAYAAGIATLSQLTPPESPDVAPGQPEPLPPYSPQPELLNVLAGVRALAEGGR